MTNKKKEVGSRADAVDSERLWTKLCVLLLFVVFRNSNFTDVKKKSRQTFFSINLQCFMSKLVINVQICKKRKTHNKNGYVGHFTSFFFFTILWTFPVIFRYTLERKLSREWKSVSNEYRLHTIRYWKVTRVKTDGALLVKVFLFYFQQTFLFRRVYRTYVRNYEIRIVFSVETRLRIVDQ